MKSKNLSSAIQIGILISICLTISACQHRPSAVFSSSCEVPCWRQIHPGVSTREDVIEIINGFADLKSDELWQGGEDRSSGAIGFTLSNGENVTMYFTDGIVSVIHFFDEKGIVSLDELIQEFGEPTAAIQSSIMGYGLPVGATSAWHAWFYGLDTKIGITYGFDTYRYFGKITIISEKTKVTEIQFFDPGNLEALLKIGPLIKADGEELSPEALHPWMGFGDIDLLYPEK